LISAVERPDGAVTALEESSDVAEDVSISCFIYSNSVIH